MEKVKSYRQLVKGILQQEYDELLDNPNKSVKPILIQDEKRGHYLLCLDGWNGPHRIYGCSLHVEVNDEGKVWLYLDETNLNFGQLLIEKGVAKEDVVPAFIAPSRRADTEYAVA